MKNSYFVRPDALKSEFVETVENNSAVKILEVDTKKKTIDQQITQFYG